MHGLELDGFKAFNQPVYDAKELKQEISLQGFNGIKERERAEAVLHENMSASNTSNTQKASKFYNEEYSKSLYGLEKKLLKFLLRKGRKGFVKPEGEGETKEEGGESSGEPAI